MDFTILSKYTKTRLKIKVHLFIAKQRFLNKIPVFKVHGMMRVGTNYIQKLIERNFNAKVLGSEEFGWKHGKIKYTSYLNYIVVCKDPLSWLLSFRHWEEIHERTRCNSLIEFIKNDVTHPYLKEEWCSKNVIELWNEAYNSWLKYSDRHNVLFIKYEDIIANLNDSMSMIDKKFNLVKKNEFYLDINKRADDWQTPHRRKPLDIDYYKNKNYIDDITQGEMHFISKSLNRTVLKNLGYHSIVPV